MGYPKSGPMQGVELERFRALSRPVGPMIDECIARGDWHDAHQLIVDARRVKLGLDYEDEKAAEIDALAMMCIIHADRGESMMVMRRAFEMSQVKHRKEPEMIPADVWELTSYTLGLDTQTCNVLDHFAIERIEQIISHPPGWYMTLPNFARTKLDKMALAIEHVSDMLTHDENIERFKCVANSEWFHRIVHGKWPARIDSVRRKR